LLCWRCCPFRTDKLPAVRHDCK